MRLDVDIVKALGTGFAAAAEVALKNGWDEASFLKLAWLVFRHERDGQALPDRQAGMWRRVGSIEICVGCDAVREGTISFALSHASRCGLAKSLAAKPACSSEESCPFCAFPSSPPRKRDGVLERDHEPLIGVTTDGRSDPRSPR